MHLMKEKDNKMNFLGQQPDKEKSENNLPGYASYPAGEDIYNKDKEEKDMNPDNISETKALNEDDGTNNEKAFDDDLSGSDLDIPGSELDDQQEAIGNEDEENNHYSIGGDDHHNLDENNDA